MNPWNNRIRFAILAIMISTNGAIVAAAQGQTTGEKNYKKNCTACHGVDGYANTAAGKQLKARDFHSPDVQKETDETLAGIIAKGKNNMPSFEKTLKPNEILDLVKYIRTFAKK